MTGNVSYITYLIDTHFENLPFAVFCIPKLVFCLKFVYRNTFFAFSLNAAQNSWSNKGSSFNTIFNRTDSS